MVGSGLRFTTSFAINAVPAVVALALVLDPRDDAPPTAEWRRPGAVAVRVEASTDLPATPERVWEQIRRWEDQSRWIRDAVWVRVLTPEREGVGVRVRVLNRVLLVPLFTEQLEVTGWSRPGAS